MQVFCGVGLPSEPLNIPDLVPELVPRVVWTSKRTTDIY